MPRDSEVLAEIIARHVAGAIPKEDASRIVFVARVQDGFWDGWSPEKEQKRLAEIKALLVKAQRKWGGMHPIAQLYVRDAARCHRPNALALLDWGDFTTTAFPEAMSALAAGSDPGKSKTADAAAVLDECRRIWSKRSGRKAPSAASAPFCAFVGDVFNALGFETGVKTAFNTLARLKATQNRR